ncbi:MAG: hypothetical protein HYY16_04310 [Planctomycetes bacterium]|nr:hypothetical protein [Planctomycetota bacterium]
MTQAIWATFLALIAAQQDMVASRPEHGISIRKPPDEKWKTQNEGRFFKEAVCVTHNLVDLSLEAVAQFAEEGKQFPELKEIGKDILGKYHENTKPKDDKDAPWKDFKVVKEDGKAKFRGGQGVGQTNAFHIEAVITYPNEGKQELREWIFVKGSGLYRFVILCAPGEYQKKTREIQFIMQNFRIMKREQKK